MCGITGFLDKTKTEQDLVLMTNCVAHRGPDASGFYFDAADATGLGHRRLSILDLSEAANQPFHSRNGRYVMVYNGEVYNFKEVEAKYNLVTQTTSDSEVIIEAFAKVGLDCIKEFNGMFAIAIWDKIAKQLYLIRDRIGIKPLYYSCTSTSFAFASELKSLFNSKVSRDINHTAIANFLHLGYIPGDETIYTSCKKLKPGHYAVVSEKELKVQSYWQPENHMKEQTLNDEATAQTELKALVRSSVEYCMISDVPLGIFLSGGVDSSLVAAVAQTLSDKPVKTFSIAFDDKKYNEAPFAKKVAEHIGSDHHTFTVTEHEALELVDRLLNVYDEPYADSSAIPTMMVSKLARQEVTVALSGDGGDELFMGYGFYYWARRLSNPLVKIGRKPISAVLHAFGNNRMKRASYMFDYPEAHKKSHIFSQEQYYFTGKEIQSILCNPSPVSIDEQINFSGRKMDWPEQQSLFDIKNYLPEELLVKTDRASMVYGLEVRVPLLDHRLVEFALNLSPDLKLKGETAKYLLKKVLYEYVPAPLFDRPKWGFAVPLAKWLKSDLGYLLERYLNKKVIQECGLVHYEAVEKLKDEFARGRDYLYARIWTLIILHKWMKEVN